MPKFCIICYAEVNAIESLAKSSHGEVSSGEGPETPMRFFELVERYLDDVRENDKEKGQHGRLVKKSVIEEVIHSGLTTCGDCSKIVESYCQLFHQMKTIQLKLNWKLWTLKNIISGAQSAPGRTNKIRQSFIRKQRELNWQDWDNDNETISEQKIDQFLEYKKDLVRKCGRKLGKSIPKLLIRRICPSQTENVPPHVPKIEISDEGGSQCDGDEFLAEHEHVPPQPIPGPEVVARPTPKNLRATEATTSRLWTVCTCPECKETFSSAWELFQHKISHEKEKRILSEAESSEDDGEENDSNNTFKPIMEPFQGDDPDELHEGASGLDREASANTSNNDDAIGSSEGDSKLDLADVIKIEPEEEDNAIDDDEDDGSDYSNYSAIDRMDTDLSSSTGSVEVEDDAEDIEVLEPESRENSNSSSDLLPVVSYNPQKEKYDCNLCSQDFELKQDCQLHVAVSHNKATYKCAVCGKGYHSKSAGKRHLLAAHKKIRFKCRQCSKSYSQKNNLQRHLKTKCGTQMSRMHQCDQCGKAFLSRHDLSRHVRGVHLGTKDFVCDICGKGFLRPGGLKEHVTALHEGVKKMFKMFKCPDCGKEFKDARNFNSHLKFVHMGHGRPRLARVNCEKCNKSFSTKYLLKLHEQSVHAGLKFTCPACKTDFAYARGLARHKRRTNCGKERDH